MKIAILSFHSGQVERGAENWAAQLSQVLKPEHELKIFGGNSSEGMLAFCFRALKELSDFQIVIPVNGRLQAILTRIYCLFWSKKMIIVGHSGKGLDDRINLYCFPDVFVGLSQFACEWARNINPIVKVVHIPNGVDLELFTPLGQKASIKLNSPIVIAVGAFEKSKQLDLTIRAVAKTKFSLLLLGAGSQRSILKGICDELLPGKYFMDSVKFKDMSKYYRAGDIFSLASWNNESYPLVYLEAMACNLPVVATDDPVRHEIVGNAGRFVNPHDTAAYARALESSATNNWGNLPRLQSEKFSWERIGLQYDQLFKQVCSQ